MQRNRQRLKTETWGPKTLRKSEKKEDTAKVRRGSLRGKSKVKQ